ncbi:MAG: biotin/lipoyl-binding protein [Elusimicrobia bacterium]|nr:biotin/lipoyl-binding protein [Elusimicrobiota bacterium]
MNTRRLRSITDWIQSTDLAEVGYHDGSTGFDFRTARDHAPAPSAAFSNRYIPICAQAVGLFQPNAPGAPRLGEEGLAVEAGDILGLVETGVGKPHPVQAPCPGRVAKVFIEPGQPVDYGQPLFFLERGA